MIFLYILAGLLLLIAVILMIRLRITVSYRNGNGCEGSPAVYLGIGPVKIRLYPKKEKKLKLSDYSPKKYRKLIESGKSQKKSPTQSKQKKEKDGESVRPGSIGETFELVSELVEKFTGHLRCEIFDLKISVGTGDAASTALTYAAVSSAVQFLLETVDNFTKLKLKHPRNICVEPDFDGGGLICDISVRFSIRVLNILRAGKGFIINYLRTMLRLENQNNAK